MNVPQLDSRSAEDILAVIRQKSEVFTPEWNFDPNSPDGGAALAMLFAEMFCGTVDRFNRLPEKLYLEFLNLIGVCPKSVTPAKGFAAAELVDKAPHNVYIKKGTQLFADTADGEDKRVVFETVSDFYATPAKIKAIYTAVPSEDIITKTELNGNQFPSVRLFSPDGDNIERHMFAIAHSAVLRLTGAAEIRIKITPFSAYETDDLLNLLCSPKFAAWSYIGKNGKVMLPPRLEDDCIVLTKPVGEAVFTDENGNTPEDSALLPWVFCEMKKSGENQRITVKAINIGSRGIDDPETGRGIVPNRVFANENELDPASPGYCFGKEPAVYDSLFIECSEAFSKSGAYITADLNISAITYNNYTDDDEEKRRFNRRLLINKADTVPQPPDDIFVSSVSWEYWNGFGWAKLQVRGDIDPFSCKGNGGRKQIGFTCPDDFAVSVHNAYRGLWIRVRIGEVENSQSLRGRRLIPLIKSIKIRFDYGDVFLPAEAVFTGNNRICEYYNGKLPSETDLFRLMPDKKSTVYFMFDKAPSGYPVNLYLDLAGKQRPRAVSYEYLAEGNNWRPLKTVDKTHGFSESGILSLYAPADFDETELFGERGFWIRAVDMSYGKSAFPVLRGIRTNAVQIIQRESVKNERYEIPAGKIQQDIFLANKPVISCDLWVNEIGEVTAAELETIDKSRVRRVTENGQLTEFWVKWEARASLSDSSKTDRHYELDPARGLIRFGDGTNGKIPAYSGKAELSVDYSYGGGSSGNLPANGLDGLISGIPFVDRMTNFEPCCGGHDGQTVDFVKSMGAKRLKHRRRAVTADDFEALITEEFVEVEEVRCFCGKNALAVRENGCITVIIKTPDIVGEAYSEALCRRVEAYLYENSCLEPVAGGRLSVIPAKVMRVSAEVGVTLSDYEYAPRAEAEIVNAIDSAIKSSGGASIGVMPTVSDVLRAIKDLKYISHVGRIMLTGEYYSNGRLVAVQLDEPDGYPYFIALGGKHTVHI